MHNSQRIILIIVAFVVLLTISVAVYAFLNPGLMNFNAAKNGQQISPTPATQVTKSMRQEASPTLQAPSPQPTAEDQNISQEDVSEEEIIFCAQDVKQCPDGSYVSRQPPTCEFAPCP
jgi:flagellar basal body-associated protein FliL